MQPWTSLKYMECLVSHKAHEIRSMQCKICRKIKAIKAYTFATTCFPLSKQNQILSHLHCPLAPLKPMRVARVAVRSWGCQGEKKAIIQPRHDPNAADKAQRFSKAGPLYPAYVMDSIWKTFKVPSPPYPCHWSWLLTKDPIDILWTFGAGMVSSAQLDSEELNLKNLATWACLKKCGKPW